MPELNVERISQRAMELGFDLFGIAPAVAPTPHFNRFSQWLSNGFQGEMAYLARQPERRGDVSLLLPGCKTVLMVGASFDRLHVPMDALLDPSRGRIARYAWGADYHDLLTPKLRQLGDFVSAHQRAYVDTGAVMERAWAQACGLGFVGKNTCLINRRKGSHLFLGAILVDVPIEPAAAGARGATPCGCGSCMRCLVACPTKAFAGPFSLDARKCISYLTIELKGEIPEALRKPMGNWVFGCDICQDVCPYVRKLDQPSHSGRLAFDVERAAPKLEALLKLDATNFNTFFRGSPVKRAKRRGLLRNACVAAANYGGNEVIPHLRTLCADDEPLIRSHAEWALRQLEAG
jgi:epoxyqueuosine reductase